MADPVEVSMRLRIARALWLNGSIAKNKVAIWDEPGRMADFDKQVYLDAADAVLDEMMEPTIDMQVAGIEQWLCEAAQEDRSRANWQAMIQAARSTP